ncbi:hypothetical protein EON65_34180 [archaeon]|nr:MAG: hypothetical protein EON65_34180 [archaeon]
MCVELDSAVKRTASSLAHIAIYYLPSLNVEIFKYSLVDFLEASCLAAIRYEDDLEDGYGDESLDAKDNYVDAIISRLTPLHFSSVIGSCFFLQNSQM